MNPQMRLQGCLLLLALVLTPGFSLAGTGPCAFDSMADSVEHLEAEREALQGELHSMFEPKMPADPVRTAELEGKIEALDRQIAALRPQETPTYSEADLRDMEARQTEALVLAGELRAKMYAVDQEQHGLSRSPEGDARFSELQAEKKRLHNQARRADDEANELGEKIRVARTQLRQLP